MVGTFRNTFQEKIKIESDCTYSLKFFEYSGKQIEKSPKTREFLKLKKKLWLIISTKKCIFIKLNQINFNKSISYL